LLQEELHVPALLHVSVVQALPSLQAALLLQTGAAHAGKVPHCVGAIQPHPELSVQD
jgi:hypothetical protein